MVAVARWVNEYDLINDNELDSRKHFRLFTVVQDKPRVTCSPDAARKTLAHGNCCAGCGAMS